MADTGQGIRPEHLEKIFDPFFTTREEAGNGLGLSLSKRIVEDHTTGSRFAAASTRRGKGLYSGSHFRAQNRRISHPSSAVHARSCSNNPACIIHTLIELFPACLTSLLLESCL
ncbi:MAG: ATP-binding protein [Janthinobacterium lividum]